MHEEPDPNERWLTREDAAAILNTTPHTVSEYVARGLLKSYPNRIYRPEYDRMMLIIPTPTTSDGRAPHRLYLRTDVENLKQTHSRGYGAGLYHTGKYTTQQLASPTKLTKREQRALEAMGINTTPEDTP